MFLVMSSVSTQQNIPSSDAHAPTTTATAAVSAAVEPPAPLALNLAQLRRGEMTPTNNGEKRRIDMQREL